MTAVIYARYSSDNQREESIEADSGMHRLRRKERYHGHQALHRPCALCQNRQPPGLPADDQGQRETAV